MPSDAETRRIAVAVRKRCIEELQQAYEEAGISGLCAEGRWELALDRLRTLEPELLLDELP